MKSDSPKAGASHPKARRFPLTSVRWRIPVEVPGFPVPSRFHETGCRVLGNDSPETCPQIFLNLDDRVIEVAGAIFPFDGALVERVVRAKAAKGVADS